MTQASHYTRATSFSDDERDNAGGRSTVRTANVDAELDAVSVTANKLVDNLTLLQRDDGVMRDGAVPVSALGSDTLKLLTTGTAVVRGAWTTATVYALKDLVTQSGNTYICAVAHTSGTFATDLAAVKWLLFQIGANPAASVISFAPTANITSTNTQAALVEVDTNWRSRFTDLADVVNAAKGAGMVGFGVAVSYAAGTIGAFLRRLYSTSNGDGADLISGVGRVGDTVAAVQALAVSKADGQAQRAFALGRTTRGDSGGGQFWYDPTDTTTATNSGTVFASTSGGTGRWKRVYTGDLFDTWFGAKVDGVTDDSIAVQAMLTSVTNPRQQVCRLVSGNRILSNISLPSGVSLFGPGKDCCTVSITDTVNPAFRLNSFCQIGGFQAYHPNQTTAGPTPTVYPPVITHAVAGCSYVGIRDLRLYNAYDGIILGDAVSGVGGINISGVDGFPLHNGIVIDNCNEISRIDMPTFNVAFVGSIYTGNVIPGWVIQNGQAVRIRRADSGTVDSPLILGYKNALSFEAGVLSGSANMWTVKGAIIDLCLQPISVTNYQDGLVFLGGSITGSNGYLSLAGAAMPLGGGVAINQRIKFIGTTFRNFYDGIATCSTNVDFIDCELYNFNNHNASPIGAIAIGANNVTVKMVGGSIDGASRANTRGIDNQTPFTGVTFIADGVTFSNMGSSTIFAPTGTTLLLGKCTGLGSFFYNGLNLTQNNQGELMVGAIPAAGTWTQDSRFLRSSAAVGSPKAWSCTVAGSPGTWQSEGNL